MTVFETLVQDAEANLTIQLADVKFLADDPSSSLIRWPLANNNASNTTPIETFVIHEKIRSEHHVLFDDRRFETFMTSIRNHFRQSS
jgi:hypothetical protein